MLLGVRSDCIYGNNLEDKLTVLSQIGFHFMELVIPEEKLEEFDVQYSKSINCLINTCKLPMLTLSVGCVRMLGKLNQSELHAMQKRALNAVLYAEQFGSVSILFASNEETTNINMHYSSFLSVFEKAAEKAQSRGITICLEPVAAYSNSAIAALIRFLQLPSVKLYYDMGNCINAKEDPVEQAWLCKDIIGAIHIKGMHDYGIMDMPLSGILMALKAGGYNKTGVLEISPYDDSNRHLQESLEILTRLGYR